MKYLKHEVWKARKFDNDISFYYAAQKRNGPKAAFFPSIRNMILELLRITDV